MKAKGDYQVHPDQMVLWIVRGGGEAGTRERWPKATQGGHQARVHSDQMVLMIARQRGWAA
jgi:hypothetical protein